VKNRRLSLLYVISALSACELIADFDQSKLDGDRTVGTLPTLDGAVALVPDGGGLDGALIRDDAGTWSADSAASPVQKPSDAAMPDAARPVEDASGLDAELPPSASEDAGPDDATTDLVDAAPDLFADV
jgi:hypothetical protein